MNKAQLKKLIKPVVKEFNNKVFTKADRINRLLNEVLKNDLE